MLLPPPPVNSFASDNTAGVSPEVMAALVAANEGPALAYGDDPLTRELEQRFRDLFDAPVETLLCWGGTGANVVGIASVLQPWQAIVCTDVAHIVVDECGAPARFTGSSIAPVAHIDGKLTPDGIAPFLHWRGSQHHPQPGLASIAQATEMGTLYTTDEIGAICETAHAGGMLVHLDGARIANAVAATGDDLVTMVRDTGVDVMTFGVSKNGAMYGEAVVFLRPELAANAMFVRKQAGQLASKNRFIAAQILALLEGGRWIEQGRHANDMAQRLAARMEGIDRVQILRPPQANSVFAVVPGDLIAAMQEWSFFWDWDLDTSLVRWMTSYATTDDDIDRFAAGIAAIIG